MATIPDEEFTLCGPPELIGFVPPPPADPPAGRSLYSSSDDDDEDDGSKIASEDEDGEEVDQITPFGRTENNALTFTTSLSACLDFFFQVVPHTYKGTIFDLLSKAWKEDPLLALKLVFQLRGIRGTGKSDKLSFYDAAGWLYKHHPATLCANVAKIPQFGYYKDLLELLQRIIEGEAETRKREQEKSSHLFRKKAGEAKARAKNRESAPHRMFEGYGDSDDDSDDESDDESDGEPGVPHGEPDLVVPDGEPDLVVPDGDEAEQDGGEQPEAEIRRPKKKRGSKGYFFRKGAAARAAKKAGTLKPREERIAEDLEKGRQLKQQASEARRIKRLTLAHRVVEKYKSDPEFARLYCSVSRVFADALSRDLAELTANGPKKARISLAAKWCPSLDSSYDRRTLLCEGIACRYFPRSGFRAEVDEHQYRAAAREKLRKEVLSPLRKALELPEVYMSAKEWHRLPYTRVASVAMKRYKELFLKHDEGRFKGFLDKVEKGEKKIAAGALLPHEILRDAIRSGEQARVSELQWRSMVEEMKTNGSLVDSISICDVSGSMSGEPIQVSIALGMLTAELAGEPWKNKLITFSHEPEFQEIKGESLAERHRFVGRMPWGMNTDFQKVFDLLLKMARENELPGERMVKRVFVYSDMEFDEARGGDYDYETEKYSEGVSWETDYAQVCRKFEEAGYGGPPEIVFWNLRSSSRSTPVLKDQKGVALVSGFSKNLLKMFMENNGKVERIDPVTIMKEAVAGPLYDDLVVVEA